MAAFESIAADVFRKAGWRVRCPLAAGDLGADMVVHRGSHKYAVVLKAASEGRRDRLIPLLSQAILEAQAFVRHFPEKAAPLAVVAAPRVPASMADQVKDFVQRHAPDMAAGLIDAEGFRWFSGPGLEGLGAASSTGHGRRAALPQRLPDIFSDLNQWMLKILIGQRLPESLISVPREKIRNAAHLAQCAKVSVMSASRLVRQLAKEGFLDDDREPLQAVRVDELLERWVSRSRKVPQDVPARLIIRRDVEQVLAAMARHAPPRCCVGLFAAADALGLGFVRGVPPLLYMERLDSDVLRKAGLSLQDSGGRADLHIRVPANNREAVFRAAVLRDGLPVCDVLQVWLDSSAYPARGREQADEIRRRVLQPLFAGRS